MIVLDPHDYITFTEDYPKYFGDEYDDIEIVLAVELFAELIRDGKLTPSVPVERTITYHDPCRLNKRKGIWQEPREILRAIPGLDFRDVDRVTQWSYCSGGGAGLPVEKPEVTAKICDGGWSMRRELEVDTLVSACPWSERPLSRGRRGARDRRRRHPRAARRVAGARAHERRRERHPGRRALAELARVLGPDHLITSKPARMHRARVPAPFPVHRWADHLPDAVVLPGSTEEVAEIVRIANRSGIPVVPRSGGTGLTDGAVPLRHGILLDLKRLDRIHRARPREPHLHGRRRHEHAQAQRAARARTG